MTPARIGKIYGMTARQRAQIKLAELKAVWELLKPMQRGRLIDLIRYSHQIHENSARTKFEQPSAEVDNKVTVYPFKRPGRKRGIYRTIYGNAAYVSGPEVRTAWDLDAGHRIPISFVTREFLRTAEWFDMPKQNKGKI